MQPHLNLAFMVIFIALTGIAIVALMIGFFGIKLPFLGAEKEDNVTTHASTHREKREAKGRLKIINKATEPIDKEHHQTQSLLQRFKQAYEHK